MITFLIVEFSLLMCVWLFLVYQNFKSRREFKKVVGSSYYPLMSILKMFGDSDEKNINPKFAKACKEYKQKSKKFLLIWVASISIVLVLTFIAGFLSVLI